MYVAVKGDHVATRRILLDPVNQDQLSKPSVYGDTALHLAFQAGSLEVARALLEHKADIMAKKKRNKTPKVLALHTGHTNMIRILSSEFGIPT